MLTLKVPDDVVAHVEPLAQALGKTAKEYIHDAFFELLEDMEDAQIATQRLKDIQSGKSRTYSAQELRKELGLDD